MSLTVARDKAAFDSGDYDVAQINETFLFVVVCHRVGIDSQEAIDRSCFPAGTSSGWKLLERDELPEGWWEGEAATEGKDTPYPQPCSMHPETHVHVVGSC